MRVGDLDLGYNYGYTRSVKTAISIPDRVFEAAERTAERLGLSRSALYTRAVEAFLAQVQPELIAEALDRVYAEEEAGLDPRLARMQAASLPKDEW